MAVKMIRIDDRLIHGQIVAAWVKSLSIKRIWIVDDGVAKDTFITGTDEVGRLLPELDGSDKNTLILVKYPKVAKLLFDSGVLLRELNVGGMGANAERRKLFKNISASEEERKTLIELKEEGVKVYFQVTPHEKQTVFEG